MVMPTPEALEYCRRWHWRKYFVWMRHDPTKARMHRNMALSIKPNKTFKQGKASDAIQYEASEPLARVVGADECDREEGERKGCEVEPFLGPREPITVTSTEFPT